MPARTGSECLLLRFARFGAFWPRKVEVPLLSSNPGLFYARHREWRGTGSGAAQGVARHRLARLTGRARKGRPFATGGGYDGQDGRKAQDDRDGQEGPSLATG